MRRDEGERECGGRFHVAVTATLVLLAKAMGRDGGERVALMSNLQCVECRKVRFARERSGDLTTHCIPSLTSVLAQSDCPSALVREFREPLSPGAGAHRNGLGDLVRCKWQLNSWFHKAT